MKSKQPPKIILSGGGTGGHLFPALALADAIAERYPNAEIRFVGARGRLEMDRVPQAGYPIDGLWISGIQRSNMLQNLLFPLKLLSSMGAALGIVMRHRPDVAVGTGGYASGPLLWAAALIGIPTIVQEQNSYPGITNKWLGKKAKAICVAYPGTERFFPANRIVLTGNPLRKGLQSKDLQRADALKHWGLEDKPTLFVTGGSLGARALNQFVKTHLSELLSQGIQVIWQTGKTYYPTLQGEVTAQTGLIMVPFVEDMDQAYAAADVVMSRAGAGTISELLALGKVAVLVPSPNVAEDHQTKNARSVESEGGAVCIAEADLPNALPTLLNLLQHATQREALSQMARSLAKPHATEAIVDVIEHWAGWKR
jgi:UDP-N-acetylglucosamine--N-acetylmuramyl-(pentapeptide) pyrophosphoryl-undecaprenol N-acetylglucosamine transferase